MLKQGGLRTSVNKPPPQPTSSTFMPFRGSGPSNSSKSFSVTFSSYRLTIFSRSLKNCTLTLFIRCNTLKSPFSFHHVCDNEEKCDTSSGEIVLMCLLLPMLDDAAVGAVRNREVRLLEVDRSVPRRASRQRGHDRGCSDLLSERVACIFVVVISLHGKSCVGCQKARPSISRLGLYRHVGQHGQDCDMIHLELRMSLILSPVRLQ